MRRTRGVAALLAIGFLASCSSEDLTGVADRAGANPSEVTGASLADISGEWNWRNEEILSFPPFIAAMLGVVPEGPEGHNTRARCESAGTMTLVQSGDTFTGTATKTFNDCETKGGQSFNQPGAFLLISDGRITGRSLQFSFTGSVTVTPCPHHAVVSAVDNGVAVALSGTGRCILPDHPQSESPFQQDPQTDKGGLSKTLSWEAVRP